jgi:hypothetical protein
MMRSIQILLIVSLLALASVVSAQTPVKCGMIAVAGPSEVDMGAAVVFTVTIDGMSYTTKPELKWKVSTGTITSGQGTDAITVDTTGLGGVEIIATAELSGVPQGCKASASIATKVKPPIVDFFPFDRYGDISFEDEKARLDNFAIQISNESGSIGQILMFAGRETFPNETRERLARAKSYLVNVRGLNPKRILTNDCGFSSELNIQLQVVSPDLAPVICDNSIKIPLSEVKFTKPRPKSAPRRR